MPSERHALGSGVEDDKDNGFVAGHSPVHCVNCFRNRLSRRKVLLLSIFLSLEYKFSGENVGGAWHRMTVLFKFGVRRESDFQD